MGFADELAARVERADRVDDVDDLNDIPREDDGLNELLARARNDDETAFEALLKRYAGMIVSMVARSGRGLPESDLEDLHQEAMIAFCKAALSYAPGQVTFGLYAKICVRNELSSRLRAMTRRIGRSALPLEDAPEGATDDPTGTLIEQERLLELQERIDSILSPYERRIFWLYVMRLSAEEIAAKVGGERKSVENAIYRIRRKLRTQLKK